MLWGLRKCSQVFGVAHNCRLQWSTVLPLRDGMPIQLSAVARDGSAVCVCREPRKVFRDLYSAVDRHTLSVVLGARDQERYWGSLMASKLSTVSRRNLSFCDWRFVHRARLNLTPTNAISHSGCPKTCRRCGQEVESLSHVLNSCRVHHRRWMLKHEAVVARVAEVATSANPHLQVTANRTVDNSGLRPDLVLTDPISKRALIVDVKCPIDLRDRIHTVRREVETKYAGIARSLQQQGLVVQVKAFVVGSLGSFPGSNWAVFRWLGASSKTYAAVARSLIRHNIHQSRNTWVDHVPGGW